MSLTFCNVHFTQAPDRVVYVSGALMKNLKLSGRKSVHLRLGGERVPAAIKRINKAGNHLYLASGVRRGIKIPKPGGVYLRSQQEGEVQIGPLIGVLSDGPTSSPTNPFGSRTAFIKQLLRQGSRVSYIFAFTPRDIHWEDETVNGYFLNEAGRCLTWFITVSPAAEPKQPAQSVSFGNGSSAGGSLSLTGVFLINPIFIVCWKKTPQWAATFRNRS